MVSDAMTDPLTAIVDDLAEHGGAYTLQRDGRNVAVLVDPDTHRALIEGVYGEESEER
jgi:hypothetical protein